MVKLVSSISNCSPISLVDNACFFFMQTHSLQDPNERECINNDAYFQQVRKIELHLYIVSGLTCTYCMFQLLHFYFSEELYDIRNLSAAMLKVTTHLINFILTFRLLQIFECPRMKFNEIPQRLSALLYPPDAIVIKHLIR